VVLQGPSGTWEMWAALYILEGAVAEVRGSAFDGWVDVSDGASVTFEDSAFTGHAYFEGPGQMTLRGNSFAANAGTGNGGAEFVGVPNGIFEGNEVTAGAIAVAGGTDVEIRDNVVGALGIQVLDEGTQALISANTIAPTRSGITVGPGASATIEGNSITGGLVGLNLQSAAVRAEANTITGAQNGISVVGDATPTITGNTLCDNDTDLRVSEGNPTSLEGNEVCPPGASPAASG
jgi:nitrous oxidase accessory protein NosD